MAWDNSKDTFQAQPGVPDDQQLTASEWNAHVSDQKSHATRHEDGGADELDVTGLSGVLADPQPTYTVTTETSDYTAGIHDAVLADASGAALTVTLPAPSTDVLVAVKKTDATSNAVTIATPGTETIDGDTERTVTAQYVSRTITSDGSDYFII